MKVLQDVVESDGAVLEAAPVPGPLKGAPSAWRLIRSVGWWYLGAQFLAVLAVIPIILVEFAEGVRFDDVAGHRIVLWSGVVVGSLVLQTVMLLVGVSKARRLGHGNLMQGLGAGPIQRPKLVAVLGVVMVPAAMGIELVLRHFGLGSTLRFWPDHAAMGGIVGALLGSVWLLLVNIAAPICEEVFFRGWLWTALRQRWTVGPTMAATSLLWLAWHLEQGVAKVLVVLPAALVLGLVRHYGGSLRASMAVHAANNLVASGIVLVSLLWH